MLVLAYAGSAYGWYRRMNSLVHPAVVHSLSWLVPIFWLWLFSDDLSPISSRLAILLLGASAAFFQPFVWLPRCEIEARPLRARLPWTRGVTVALCATFLLPLTSAMLAYRGLGQQGGLSLAGLRESLTGEAQAPSIGVGYFFPLVVGAMFFAQQACPYRWLRIMSVVSAGMMALLTTSKIYFLITLFVLAVPSRKVSTTVVLRRLASGGVVGLAIFAALHLALGKIIGFDDSFTVGDTARAGSSRWPSTSVARSLRWIRSCCSGTGSPTDTC